MGENLLNGNASPHVLTMVNFGPPAVEICWRLGSPANVNGFRVLARCLAVSWAGTKEGKFFTPSLAGTLHIDFPGLLDRLYWQHYCTALKQWASAELRGVEQMSPPIFAGRPSRWAWAHTHTPV